jgi:DNA-directed RNA polymerase subunit N (RpoN/RPB10)
MDEVDILLPVRCITCGFVLGQYQEKYEYLVSIGSLSMENIIKMINPEGLNDSDILYEKELRSTFFKIDKTRDCCLTNLLSPIVLPRAEKPIYPNPSKREEMMVSKSVGRETPGYERPITRFYTKSFSDVSNKRKLPKREEMGLVDFPDEDKMDIDKPTVEISHGIATLSRDVPTPIFPTFPTVSTIPAVPTVSMVPTTPTAFEVPTIPTVHTVPTTSSKIFLPGGFTSIKSVPTFTGIKQTSSGSSVPIMRTPPPLSTLRSIPLSGSSVPIIPKSTVQVNLSGLIKK